MRPFSIPQKLKPLTEDQFAQLHAWLDDPADTYMKIRKKLLDDFGIKISDSTLSRYCQNRDLARHLTEKEEDADAVRDFLAIMNGQPVPYSEAGIELVMKRAFNLATAREMTPAKLATLLRVFHYKKNCEWNERRHTQNERRLAQSDQRIEISNRLATVREQELALKKTLTPTPAPPPEEDELGPIATTPEGIRARAIALHGFDARELTRLAQERAKAAASITTGASPEAPKFMSSQFPSSDQQTTNNEQTYETNILQSRMPETS